MPVDSSFGGVEELGALGEVGFHVREGFERGAFDDVEDGVADERGGEEFAVGGGEVCDDGAAERVADEDQGRERGPGEVGLGCLQHC